jgi:hypothetical protein
VRELLFPACPQQSLQAKPYLAVKSPDVTAPAARGRASPLMLVDVLAIRAQSAFAQGRWAYFI